MLPLEKNWGKDKQKLLIVTMGFIFAICHESKIVLKLKLKEKTVLNKTFDSEGFRGSSINLLTFKVINDRHVLIAVLLLVLWLVLWFSVHFSLF